MSDLAVLLSPQLLRNLADKLYEKRKNAALDIERFVRDGLQNKVPNFDVTVKQIIRILSQEFALNSANTNARNGGLIGLAGVSIAEEVANYLPEILPPILTCFQDHDARVRYYSCESLYNVAKVARVSILQWFNEIFDVLSKLAADTETSVKNGAELLDRLLKDIVSEQSIDSPLHTTPTTPLSPTSQSSLSAYFSLARFIPLLSERIRTLNPFTRSFLVSWISVLDSVPDLELVSYLPYFLDGLFRYLSDENEEVRTGSAAVLSEFLRQIREAVEVQRQLGVGFGKFFRTDSQVTDSSEKSESQAEIVGELKNEEAEAKRQGTWIPGQSIVLDFPKMVQILHPFLTSNDEETQATALKWINEFILLAKQLMLPFTPNLLQSVLPFLETAIQASPSPTPPSASSTTSLDKLMPIVPDQTITPGSEIDITRSPQYGVEGGLLKESEFNVEFEFQNTLDTLMGLFSHDNEETRIASLDWVLLLHKKAPNKVVSSSTLIPALFRILSDTSDDVVKRSLQLLAQICTYSDDEYLSRFMVTLLGIFQNDRRLLETRGSLIIRQLCIALNPEKVFRCLAEILEKEEDLEFASTMVQNLNLILITAAELLDLRRRLRHLEHKDGQTFFIALYKCWSHNPVSTFSLCLLAQAYEHAANLLQIFSELEITVSFLIQIDKLVQLLESPVFTYLRLQLLEPDRYPYLYKCLYGLLMLLPQSSAFATLRNRLNSVSSIGMLHLVPRTSYDRRSSKSNDPVKFQDLLAHFRSVQSKHERTRRALLSMSRSVRKRSSAKSSSSLVLSHPSSASSSTSVSASNSNSNLNLSAQSATKSSKIPSRSGSGSTGYGFGLGLSVALDNSGSGVASFGEGRGESKGDGSEGNASSGGKGVEKKKGFGMLKK
ncbi:vacuolar protein 14 C-terminal Fig4p binding-domain-containing protein [Paraphysoderma sedebokerense]|nr:vacuolar protein 14 C-terminal Fig4p binding-domain-containing protein [Paraphysoderma sedebokerense]